jgi:hypothetical protein
MRFLTEMAAVADRPLHQSEAANKNTKAGCCCWADSEEAYL